MTVTEFRNLCEACAESKMVSPAPPTSPKNEYAYADQMAALMPDSTERFNKSQIVNVKGPYSAEVTQLAKASRPDKWTDVDTFPPTAIATGTVGAQYAVEQKDSTATSTLCCSVHKTVMTVPQGQAYALCTARFVNARAVGKPMGENVKGCLKVRAYCRVDEAHTREAHTRPPSLSFAHAHLPFTHHR